MKWATVEDLEAYLETPAPQNADRLLERATTLITWAAIGLTEDRLDDTNVQEALTWATCAQVEQWLETGETQAIAGYPMNTSMSVGGLSISNQPNTIAPRAIQYLSLVGLQRPVAY